MEPRIFPDLTHESMYRIAWPDGVISGMSNLSRVRDAVREAGFNPGPPGQAPSAFAAEDALAFAAGVDDDVALTIIVKPLPGTPEGQLWQAWLGDELLCTKREPFLAAARVLQARGLPDDTPLLMKHAGSDMICLRAKLGKAAKQTVLDKPSMARPLFAPFRGSPDLD